MTSSEFENKKLLSKIETIERAKKSAEMKLETLRTETENKLTKLREEKDVLEDR